MSQEKISPNQIALAGEILALVCHEAAYLAGWWREHKADVLSYDHRVEVRQRTRFGLALAAEKIALIHSEVSEAIEGLRKDKADDHLPHRKSVEVELADAVIRIADLAGAMQLDLGGAIAEKMAYNSTRPDHREENRKATGGKSF